MAMRVFSKDYLHDPGFRVEGLPPKNFFPTRAKVLSDWLIYQEGEDHKILRKQLLGTIRQIDTNRIESLTSVRLNSYLYSLGDDPSDIQKECLDSLPFHVILDYFGASRDFPRERLLSCLADSFGREFSFDDISQMENALSDAVMLARLLSETSADPVISRLVGDVGLDRASHVIIMLLVLGHHTVSATLSNALLLLTREPQAHPCTTEGARNLMRDAGGVHRVVRIARQAHESFVAGEAVALSLQIGTDGAIPFGLGPHRCAGDFIATAEIKALIGWLKTQPVEVLYTGPQVSHRTVSGFNSITVRRRFD